MRSDAVTTVASGKSRSSTFGSVMPQTMTPCDSRSSSSSLPRIIVAPTALNCVFTVGAGSTLCSGMADTSGRSMPSSTALYAGSASGAMREATTPTASQ